MQNPQPNHAHESTRFVTAAPDVLISSSWLADLIRQCTSVTTQLIETQRQLASKQCEELLTLNEVCQLTRLTEKTVRLRMADMKVVADGSKIVRFYRSEIMAWCRERTITYAELVEQKPQTGKKRNPKNVNR